MHERNEGIRSGIKDVRRAAQALAREIPARLAPLARVAYNFHWVWHADGERVFRAVDSYRWRLCRQNPVRFLEEASAGISGKGGVRPVAGQAGGGAA